MKPPIPLHRQLMMKELSLISAVAIPIIIELGYQIYQYVKRRKMEEENGSEKE